MPLTRSAAPTRSRWLAWCVLLVALVGLGHASDAHAGWKTGDDRPRAWNNIWVCPKGAKVQFATFSYPGESPQVNFEIQFHPGKLGYGDVPGRALSAGHYQLLEAPLHVNGTSGPLADMNWPRGGVGDFEAHGTFHFPFAERMNPGDFVTMRHRAPGAPAWVPGTWYQVQDCGLDGIMTPW